MLRGLQAALKREAWENACVRSVEIFLYAALPVAALVLRKD
jgi:hypothetical protein